MGEMDGGDLSVVWVEEGRGWGFGLDGWDSLLGCVSLSMAWYS